VPPVGDLDVFQGPCGVTSGGREEAETSDYWYKAWCCHIGVLRTVGREVESKSGGR
jgi:hypothetical protein